MLNKIRTLQSSSFIGEKPVLTLNELIEVFNPNSKNYRDNVDAIIVTNEDFLIEQEPIFIKGIKYNYN